MFLICEHCAKSYPLNAGLPVCGGKNHAHTFSSAFCSKTIEQEVI